jgi:hypothetical protein
MKSMIEKKNRTAKELKEFSQMRLKGVISKSQEQEKDVFD